MHAIGCPVALLESSIFPLYPVENHIHCVFSSSFFALFIFGLDYCIVSGDII